MLIKLRQKDAIILTIAALFLGVFIAVQYSLIKPSRGTVESSEAMAVEIEHLAKNNANLKTQLSDLTKKYQVYEESLNDQSALQAQIEKEQRELEIVNAATQISGQGVEISISGKLFEAQMVDLVNAIKNIGADAIAVNGKRLNLYSSINNDSEVMSYNIEIIGNSTVLESALDRKGGIINQLKDKGLNVEVSKKHDMILPAVEQTAFKYAKIVSN